MSGKLVTTDLNLQGIRRVRNIATPLHELDGVRKIDLDTAVATLNTVIANTNNGVTQSQMQAAISASVTGAIRLLGDANASAPNAFAATKSEASRVFVPGDAYRITTAGASAFGVALTVGDLVAYTPSGWLRFEGGVTPSVVQGTGVSVNVAGETYTVSLSPEVLTQLQTLTQQAAQALADAQAARQLAESLAAPISALQTFQSNASQAIAALGLSQQAQDTTIAGQVSLVSALQSFQAIAQVQLQVVYFRFSEGALTHAQGQPVALVNNESYIPIPGLSGFEICAETGADNGGIWFYVRHPKTSVPSFKAMVIDANGNADMILDQGHYFDEAVGMPTNVAWFTLPPFGSYVVAFE